MVDVILVSGEADSEKRSLVKSRLKAGFINLWLFKQTESFVLDMKLPSVLFADKPGPA